MIRLIFILLLLCGCAVGPNYVRPTVEVPQKYKEYAKHWKTAQPQDERDRGEWWKIFHDPQLNALETQLNISNQNIAIAEAQYQQARALVNEAQANYFPTITGSASVTRQKIMPLSQSSLVTTSSGSTTALSTTGPFNSHSLSLNASWEPDVWGSVRRSVEASTAGAQASAALLASTQLSSQASLAQFYFELRSLDKDQKLLNDTVTGYKKSLKLTQNRYASGVASRLDVVQAQSQLESAQALAINNGISRAQFEHAIAVLIGKPPSVFSITFKPLTATPPKIPIQVPSALLERRPDVAQAERLMAQANAQIGVAVAAYFPSLMLSAIGSIQKTGLGGQWLSLPLLGWALGPQLTQIIFDGGLRNATIDAAYANHNATIASYRQTVLSAFQDVEDNLATLRILESEAKVENNAVTSARLALKIVINQYKSGTAAYSDVINAQITAYTAEKNAADISGLRMTATVGLIKALGGGWNQDKRI